MIIRAHSEFKDLVIYNLIIFGVYNSDNKLKD